MKYYIGLDVSLATTAICAVDGNGAIVREGVAVSDPDEIAEWLEQLGVPFERVGLEAGSTVAWLYSGLRDRGISAVCIDPRRLRAVTKTMPIKNDRNDARAIAHCMRVGWYSVVHVKSEVSQVVRMLLTNRRTLLIKQIDIENEIRGTLRVLGIKLTGRVTAGPFEARVLELIAKTPHLEAIVRPMLVARSALREQCAVLHKMMLEMVRKSATCRRLMTIPGVGAITAVTFLTTIHDPDRFHRSRDVGAHLGLTPKKYASGETDRNGGISKCGDAAMRAVLYQSALSRFSRDPKGIPASGFGGLALQSAAASGERSSQSHAN